jgi:diacylglycerol kinase (ATP)
MATEPPAGDAGTLPEVPAGVLFVVNPRASSGRAGGVWNRLLAEEPALAAAEVVACDTPEAAAVEVDRRLRAGGVRRLVVVGGDGSLHLAVSRLGSCGALGSVEVGLVPAGTGSDFARGLGLPEEPRAALHRAVSGAARRVDVRRVTVDGEPRFTLNGASAGIAGLVDQRVNARRRRTALAYLLGTLGALAGYRPFSGRVEADGEPWYEGGIFLLAVANGRRYGKGMRIAPLAEPDDGLADLVLIEPMARWQVPLRLPRLYVGNLLDRPYVRYRRASVVRLVPHGPLPPLDLDGEPMPSGEATFEVLAGALAFVG